MYRIEQGDCLELMKKISDKSIDMILCDPPYGLTDCQWDSIIPFEHLWDQYKRIVKDNGAVVIFSQMPFTAQLVCSNLKNFKYMWIWYKHYRRGFLNAKKQPLRTTENICVFYKKQCTYNPRMRTGKFRNKERGRKPSDCYGNIKNVKIANDQYYPTDILDFAGVQANKIQHPTQKPVELLQYLIETYTKQGETVLDNCMGAGSTGIACLNTGRRFVGMELEEKYYKIAEKRLLEHIRVD